MENKETKIVGPDEVKSNLEDQINQTVYDLKHNLLPLLGHGQSKRLLMAVSQYPHKEEDFKSDSEAMIRAYSAFKSLIDVQVAMGVELALQGILEEQAKLKGEENNV